MRNRKAFVCMLAVLVTVLSFAGCNRNTPSPDSTAKTGQGIDVYSSADYGFQLEMPEIGDQIAIVHTTMGDICIRFFPEAAPKAVENFLTHAKNGYYDGITFHRVINDFMIQTGDPKGDGTGGDSIWGRTFVDEFDKKLLNLRGSLAMANAGPGTNGSQFFINQAGPSGSTAAELKKSFDYDTLYAQYEATYNQYVTYYGEQITGTYGTVDEFIEGYIGGISPISTLVPDAVWELYAEHGGNIHLDGAWRKTGGHTVFGQVYAGMDVVDAIAAVPVSESNNKPLQDVKIIDIDVGTYSE